MTTIESLLCEVSPLLESSLALKTAERLFFGDNVVYSDYSNEGPSSSKDMAQTHGSKEQKKGKKEKGNKDIHKAKHDGLEAAISDAKKIIQNALHDETGDTGNFANEIIQLKSEIETIKKENIKLRKAVDDLNEIVRQILVQPHDLCCSGSPLLSCGPKVLVLGDGNLSFSFGFAQVLRKSCKSDLKIWASVPEDEKDFSLRYPSGNFYLHQLQSFPYSTFVEVLFNVDACKLPLHWDRMFNSIIWNFPHPGGKTNLRKNRLLLHNTLRSIYKIIGDGTFFITFAKEQSGLCYSAIKSQDFIVQKALPGHKKDSWQVAYIAAECGFLILNAFPFYAGDVPEYCARGYKNRDQAFYNDREAVTVGLVKFEAQSALQQFRNNEELVSKLPGYVHELRPYYCHDLSIVYLDPENIERYEGIFLNILRQLTGLLLTHVCELEHMRCFAPNGFPNRIYKVTWQCWSRPLSKSCCNNLQEEVNLNESSKASELAKKEEKKEDDDFDLFGSSDEEVDEEKQRIIQDRLKAYAEKKAKKPAAVAKSSVILDVKPWDDETNMVEMEKRVREIEQDGLVWGGSKLIPLAYGLNKLQIICVIEDEKVSVEDLIDRMVDGISEHVQSVDIVAFNKI